MQQAIEKAYREALAARENAHAPYSKFKVGAALKCKGEDRLFAGCNVENASYGATICAERNAVFQMVAALGKTEPEFMVLVTQTDPPSLPCALCLQVLSEFCPPDFPIYPANLEGIGKPLRFGDLLPHPFSGDGLPGRNTAGTAEYP